MKNILNKLFKLAHYEVDNRQIALNVELARILTGFLYLFRYLDTYGYSVITDGLSDFILYATILSFSLMVGFLTPIAILLILFTTQVYNAHLWNLANMTSTITLWCLLFLGAGKNLSFDKTIFKNAQAAFSVLYGLSLELTAKLLTKIRLLAVFMFWGICYTAMAYHFHDDLWLDGKVLSLMLVTPYLSEFYFVFDFFMDHAATTFQVLCVIGLLVQGVWELFLFPLLFIRLGHKFVFYQGVAFFIICGVFINVSFLPWFEFVLWMLLFYMPNKNLKITNKLSFDLSDNKNRYKEHVFKLFSVLCYSVVSVMLLIQTLNFIFPNNSLSKLRQKFRHEFLLFGQHHVNVFNDSDMNMGNSSIVIVEKNPETGNLIRVVPFMDHLGGRLDYLRNDYLYYNQSLIWQRTPINFKYITLENNGRAISPFTNRMIKKVIMFDICQEKKNSETLYEVFFFTRSRYEVSISERWGKPELFATYDQKISNEMIENLRRLPYCESSFRLNFGHVLNNKRSEDTLKFIQKSLSKSKN